MSRSRAAGEAVSLNSAHNAASSSAASGEISLPGLRVRGATVVAADFAFVFASGLARAAVLDADFAAVFAALAVLAAGTRAPSPSGSEVFAVLAISLWGAIGGEPRRAANG